jgi:hypothetical protein
MDNFIAYLNARTISTRFHIRVATVKAVHVMWGPTGINLRVGARPTLYERDGPTPGLMAFNRSHLCRRGIESRIMIRTTP